MPDGVPDRGEEAGHSTGAAAAAAAAAVAPAVAPAGSGPSEHVTDEAPATTTSTDADVETDTDDAAAAAADVAATPPPDYAPPDDIYGAEDDAQSFIQPAISPMATRLSSPRTPAAEKALAMDRLVRSSGSFFGRPAAASSAGVPASSASRRPATAAPLPPAKAAPTSAFAFTAPSLASVFPPSSRHGRSSSVGADALRRLSKALPSLSFPSPSSFLPSLTMNTAFFSSASPSSPRGAAAATTTTAATAATTPSAVAHPRPPSVASRRTYALRRSTSDDSLLYHTLSHTPSLGDDGQFEHIREQVNSRVKAILDSFDRPTFRMPNFFPDAKTPPRDPLDAALEMLTGDVVVLGGYRGSVLRSAEPPHRQLWVPVKVGLKIRKVNLAVGLDPEDEAAARQHIFPSGMLTHIGPVDIARRLFKRLRECDNARRGLLRVHDYGYDWRLSPARLSAELVAFLAALPCNQEGHAGSGGALVIAHSLGGLITRHAVNQRPDLFAGVVFAGTPQRCINILGPLRNGDAVLLNEKVLTAPVNFSLRTTFVFLPEDGFCFVNRSDPRREYRVDFYDVRDWLRYRWCPCVGFPPLPPAASLPGVLPSLPLPLRSRRNTSGAEADGGPLRAEDETTPAPEDATAPDDRPDDRPDLPDDRSDDLDPEPRPAVPPADPQQARALAYLERTLAETKAFRAGLAHRPAHAAANAYPPLAVLYGKGIPTVYAARVASRAAIARADAYDDLVFRSGDGVVLARAALLPPGYHTVRGGHVSSDRGHISLLGDLHAVGRALEAVVCGRQKGIGLGPQGGGGGGGGRAAAAARGGVAAPSRGGVASPVQTADATTEAPAFAPANEAAVPAEA